LISARIILGAAARILEAKKIDSLIDDHAAIARRYG
jgi:hypothetical protein